MQYATYMYEGHHYFIVSIFPEHFVNRRTFMIKITVYLIQKCSHIEIIKMHNVQPLLMIN